MGHKTSSDILSKTSKHIQSRHYIGNTRSITQRGHIQSNSSTMFSFPHLSRSKENRGEPVHNKFNKVKQTHYRSTISHGQSQCARINAPTSSMASINRPHRRLFPYTNKVHSAQISSLHPCRLPLFLQSPPLWAKRGPIYIYKGSALPFVSPSPTMHLRTGLSRRLGYLGSFPRSYQQVSSKDYRNSSKSRLSHQFQEIRTHSPYRHRMARSTVALPQRSLGYSRNKTNRGHATHSELPLSKNLFKERVGKAPRSPQFCNPDPLVFSIPPATTCSTSAYRQSCQQGCASSYTTTTPQSSRALDKPTNPRTDGIISLLKKSDSPVDRCLFTRLGGHTNSQEVSGTWSINEKSLHINLLEVRAVRYSLQHLALEQTTVHLFIDNSPAQCALNKLSCKSHSLREEISLLITLLEETEVKLRAYRISTLLNSRADALIWTSHHSIEWELPQVIFNHLTSLRGPLEIDLMATHQNTKLPLYLSPHPDPLATGCNTLAWDWNKWQQIYLFPPKWFIPTIIDKLQTYKYHGIIILPWYPAEPWFTYILNRSTHQWHLSLPDPTKNGRSASEKWTAFNF